MSSHYGLFKVNIYKYLFASQYSFQRFPSIHLTAFSATISKVFSELIPEDSEDSVKGKTSTSSTSFTHPECSLFMIYKHNVTIPTFQSAKTSLSQFIRVDHHLLSQRTSIWLPIFFLTM